MYAVIVQRDEIGVESVRLQGVALLGSPNTKAGSSPGFFVYVKYFSDFYIS
jgi:hypothetical protein